jgi:hypothetical protein
MRVRTRYIGQEARSRVPLGKILTSKEKYVLGEVGRRGRWHIKLSVPPPSDAEMQRVVRLANESHPKDKDFVFFVRRLIEAQGDYARKRRLREKVKIRGLRLPAESAKVARRYRAAIESLVEARRKKKHPHAEMAELAQAELEYGALQDARGGIRLVRTILTGGAEDDPHAWRVNFPVGAGQLDIPYELRFRVRSGRVVGELVPCPVETAFARGTGQTDTRAKYVSVLVRMALHGSLKRLNRCITCDRFTLKKKSRAGHSYCSRTCERNYDAELKRPGRIEREMSKLPLESRGRLEASEGWYEMSEEERLKAIAQLRFRSRLYRG